TDRRAHTPSAVGARSETDSGTDPGNARPLVMGYTRLPDSRRAGSSAWLRPPADVRLRAGTRRFATGRGPPEQRREFLDALSQLQDLLPKLRLCEARDVHTDHDRRRRSEPPTRRRARHTDPWRWSGPRCVGPDPGADGHNVAVGETRISCGDHRPFADAAQFVTGGADVRYRDDNSHEKVHNVGGHSFAISSVASRV